MLTRQRVHHACNAHGFYYCAVCFVTFDNQEQRETHDPKHCKNYKCVTEGCPIYGTFSVLSCNHPGRKNSQTSIWRALVKLGRSLETNRVSSGQTNNTSSPTAGPSTPVNRNHPASSQSGQSSNRRRNTRLLSSPSVFVTSPATPDSSITTVSGEESYRQGLQALACALLRQLEVPDPDGLHVLKIMYSSYMHDSAQNSPNEYRSHEWASVVDGLKNLCEQMWKTVQKPGKCPRYNPYVKHGVPCLT